MTSFKLDELIAIDVHTHAEVSCRYPIDEVWQEYEKAASVYFKAGSRRSPKRSLTIVSGTSGW